MSPGVIGDRETELKGLLEGVTGVSMSTPTTPHHEGTGGDQAATEEGELAEDGGAGCRELSGALRHCSGAGAHRGRSEDDRTTQLHGGGGD